MAQALLIIAKIFGALPLALRSLFGKVAGTFLSLFPTRDRRIARLQLQRFLPAEVERPSIAAVYANLGQAFMESLNILGILDRAPLGIIDAPPADFFASVRASERPIITLTAHTSNWDLLAAYCIKHGLPLAAVGKKARNPIFQELLDHMRSAYGIKTIWREQPGAAKELIRALQPGSIVAALIDQDTTVAGRFIPFLGEQAYTPDSLVELGKRRNARFFSAFIARTSLCRYKFFIEEIPSSLSESEILTEYHHHLERFICTYPSQWVWVHKRWRTRPNGVRLSSAEYLKFLTSKT